MGAEVMEDPHARAILATIEVLTSTISRLVSAGRLASYGMAHVLRQAEADLEPLSDAEFLPELADHWRRMAAYLDEVTEDQ